MKVFVAQINPTVGDLKGNFHLICDRIQLALQANCDVVVFPELATVGYPPRDLLYMDILWQQHKETIRSLESFLKKHKMITVIVGGLHELDWGFRRFYNAAWILNKNGKKVIHKILLPRYDVFDEARYFTPATHEPLLPVKIPVQYRNGKFYDEYCNVLICEDIWNNEFIADLNERWPNSNTYGFDPVAHLLPGKPLFVLNASPFWHHKIEQTQQLIQDVTYRLKSPVVWCNQIGAHDDIITGGYSMVSLCSVTNHVHLRKAKAFQEDQMIVEFADQATPHSKLYADKQPGQEPVEKITKNEATYKALCLHLSDYKRRCGFQRAVLGLSGGIDSAVVAVIAAHVFGSNNVMALAMPSPYSSEDSINDAKELAKNLSIGFQVKSISELYQKTRNLFLSGGRQQFENPVTDENIQPRLRAMLLMAHANDNEPCLLLTTGNKSEIAVGYTTIYGDMCGGIGVLSDLWKTEVYELAQYLNNAFSDIIPKNIIDKPPSAQLKPEQKDTDSLPPYDILDQILKLFVEEDKLVSDVVPWALSYVPQVSRMETIKMVNKVWRLYRNSEFKRQQMPLGPKISRRAFGSGRRFPIACKLNF